MLAGRGHRVAIVTRGYGGNSKTWPREVTADSDPRDVGDEPVLMAQKTAALVIADPDRVRAAELGADYYLTKPFSVVELRHKARQLIARFRGINSWILSSNAAARADQVIQ